jgi:large subunit ribosomal protein L24e
MKCSYCSSEVKTGTGTMYVYKTGTINYFCSSKCYKNAILVGRKINKKNIAKERKSKA